MRKESYESADNSNKLYYYDRDNICGKFNNWCDSLNTITNISTGDERINFVVLLKEIKNEMKLVKKDRKFVL